MNYPFLWLLLALLQLSRGAPSENDGKDGAAPPDLFCAVLNPLTGTYIDLSQLSSTPNEVTDPKTKKKVRRESSKTRWLVKGWGIDSGKNFTVSVCSSPIEKKKKGEETTHELSNTTGAYYSEVGNDDVSIGDFSTKPMLFGSSSRKLTLKYENGSFCPGSKTLRKSTLLSFVCDREITTKAQISYIGSLQNCSYFFEVRSVHACPTSNKSNEINVLGIFLGIIAVFVLVQYMRRAMQRRIKLSGGSDDMAGELGGSHARQAFSQPDWEFFENRTVVRKIGHSLGHALRLAASPFVVLWQRLQGDIPGMRRRGSAGGSGSRPIHLYSTPFASGSQSSFFRDMEVQNNILDSLEVQSASGSSAATTTNNSNPNPGITGDAPSDGENSIL